jgi:hypothetical protein
MVTVTQMTALSRSMRLSISLRAELRMILDASQRQRGSLKKRILLPCKTSPSTTHNSRCHQEPRNQAILVRRPSIDKSRRLTTCLGSQGRCIAPPVVTKSPLRQDRALPRAVQPARFPLTLPSLDRALGLAFRIPLLPDTQTLRVLSQGVASLNNVKPLASIRRQC